MKMGFAGGVCGWFAHMNFFAFIHLQQNESFLMSTCTTMVSAGCMCLCLCVCVFTHRLTVSFRGGSSVTVASYSSSLSGNGFRSSNLSST